MQSIFTRNIKPPENSSAGLKHCHYSSKNVCNRIKTKKLKKHSTIKKVSCVVQHTQTFWPVAWVKILQPHFETRTSVIIGIFTGRFLNRRFGHHQIFPGNMSYCFIS